MDEIKQELCTRLQDLWDMVVGADAKEPAADALLQEYDGIVSLAREFHLPAFEVGSSISNGELRQTTELARKRLGCPEREISLFAPGFFDD